MGVHGLDILFLPSLKRRLVPAQAPACSMLQGNHCARHDSIRSMPNPSFIWDRSTCMQCSLFGKHKVFLTNGQGLNKFTSDHEGILFEVEHETVLAHERGSDDHIVMINVHDIKIGIVLMYRPSSN